MNLVSYLSGENYTTVRIGNGSATDQLFEVPNTGDAVFTWEKSNLTLSEYQAESGVDTTFNISLMNQIQLMGSALSAIYFNAQ